MGAIVAMEQASATGSLAEIKAPKAHVDWGFNKI